MLRIQPITLCKCLIFNSLALDCEYLVFGKKSCKYNISKNHIIQSRTRKNDKNKLLDQKVAKKLILDVQPLKTVCLFIFVFCLLVYFLSSLLFWVILVVVVVRGEGVGSNREILVH